MMHRGAVTTVDVAVQEQRRASPSASFEVIAELDARDILQRAPCSRCGHLVALVGWRRRCHSAIRDAHFCRRDFHSGSGRSVMSCRRAAGSTRGVVACAQAQMMFWDNAGVAPKNTLGWVYP